MQVSFFKRLRDYFSTPQRLFFLTWLIIHIFFLCVALLFILVHFISFQRYASLPEVLVGAIPMAGFMIASFPSLVLNITIEQFFPYPRYDDFLFLVLAPSMYYGLFFVICWTARNTSSRIFRMLHILFTVLFFFNLVVGFYALFQLILTSRLSQ